MPDSGTRRVPEPGSPLTATNDTFLRALRREPTPYTPVWLMRQAGRYLPEYNATRSRAGSFMALAQSPDLATEVTLQPIDRFGLDAAILFSDILTIPDAMGLGLSFAEGEGPRFARPVRSEPDIAALGVPDRAALEYVYAAVRQIRRALAGRVPLIGFSGSPWTLACYMVEGASPGAFHHIKPLLYRRPDLLSRLLDTLVAAVSDYLVAQIDAGAEAVMVFDTWGGALADGAYQRFSLEPMRRIVAAVAEHAPTCPVILFTKGGGGWLEQIAATGAAAVGVDWTVDLAQARARVGARCALQGNLDPAILFAGNEAIEREARRVLDSFGPPGPDGATHIFNLGHGIDRNTPPEAVACLIETVHGHSRALRGA